MIVKKNMSWKLGFTFIELIVVMSIIALLSVNSVFYFHDFIWKQELSYDISQLDSLINTLDTNIKKQKSFDYTLTFDKNSYWYSVSQNTIWNNISQNATFDTVSWTGIINLTPSSTEIWEVKVYKWLKKIEHLTKNWSSSIEVKVEDTTHILWTLSWSTLNKITLWYFDTNTNAELNHTLIVDIKDITETSYDSINIRNISGNKMYLFGTTKITPPIFITFEKNWIESILELNNK